MTTKEFVRKNKVIAVIRAGSYNEAKTFAESCIEGGIKIIEVTQTFDNAEKLISTLTRFDNVLVGAGTVLDLDTAKEVAEQGAKFIVSPHTDSEIIRYSKENSIFVVSGALTSSEIVNAIKLGADMVKIFPVSAVGGASYIKAIKEPLPNVDIMVTGGVNLNNIKDYFKEGIAAAGMVSAFLGKGNEIKPDVIVKNTELIVQVINNLN